ncbi:MAG: TonB-dependent receptor [Gemmatimonadetes bacterium]|nr:TonB-dependent receptor [Gemmatimonadota bacterium]
MDGEPRVRIGRPAVGPLAGLLLLGTAATAAAQAPPSPDSVVPLEPVEVEIGRLRAGAVPLAETPFTAHVISGSVVEPTAGAIAGALAGLPGVTITNQTGSAGQLDVRLRGFSVSPIVGVPQSVSVFVDGVRVNEADASQVHLSLIPEGAIERIELVRGPVGVFGKNSLAGALNFVTRRGTRDASLDAAVHGGSFGSAGGMVRASGMLGGWDGLLLGSYRRAEGWRWLESSQELSLFGKVGWRGERTDAWLSYTFEADSLEGPGPVPESWLLGGPLPPDITSPPSDRRRLQYTGGRGDAFRPRLHFLSARIEHELGERWQLQANVFGRFANFRQANDNISEPDALGITDIASGGGSAQLLFQPEPGTLLAFGAEWSRNDVDIEIRERPNRAFPTLVEGTTERLNTQEDNVGAFAEAWWSLVPRLSLYASARYDHVDLPVTDLLDPGDSGENVFSEVSGGLGVSADVALGFSAFAGYGRGFRAPVILEVTCADPADPCQLPFGLGPDPPLEPVRSDTWQAGARLSRERLGASLVAYWTEVHDDIFNVVDEATPTLGYFTNLERTRRIGLELSASGSPVSALAGLRMSGSLAWTRATFETDAELPSPFVEDDSVAPGGPSEGAVEVEPGDLFPMIPQLAGTLNLSFELAATTVAIEGSWTGRRYLVGDEGNDQEFGRLGASTIVDISFERRFGRAVAFLEFANALDSDHHDFGIVAENGRAAIVGPERFLTPALPRRLSAGLSVRLLGDVD